MSWGAREGGGRDTPAFGGPRIEGEQSTGSHHPNLGDLLLKTHQSVLVVLLLVVPLKGDGADPLGNWGRIIEVVRLSSELPGKGKAPRKKQQGTKYPGSGDASRNQASSARGLREKREDEVIRKCYRK